MQSTSMEIFMALSTIVSSSTPHMRISLLASEMERNPGVDHSRWAQPKPYSWESLMPEGCVALRVGEETQQGDLKLSCNDKWIKVVAGLIITGEHGPVCRRKPELFTAILRDKHGRLTADVLVQAGKSYSVDALGRLIEIEVEE